MLIRIENRTAGPLWCGPVREQAVLVYPDTVATMAVSSPRSEIGVWHTYGSRMDGEDVCVVLDSVFTFSDLEEGDTVELFREKLAVAKTGRRDYVFYDRVFARCRVANRPAEKHTIVGQAVVQQEIQKCYRDNVRFDVWLVTLLDMWWELIVDIGASLLLFILLWVAYGFWKALLFAGVGCVALFLFTAGLNWLLDGIRHRKSRRRRLHWVQEETVAAYYAQPRREPVDGLVGH